MHASNSVRLFSSAAAGASSVDGYLRLTPALVAAAGDGSGAQKRRGPPAFMRTGDSRKRAVKRRVTALEAITAAAAAEEGTVPSDEAKVVAWARDNTNVNTSNAYAGQYRRYEAWCAEQAPPRQAMPSSDAQVLLYLIHLGDDNALSVSSIQQALSGIKREHVLSGHAVPCSGGTVESIVMGALEKKHARPTVPRQPIGRDHFEQIWHKLPRTAAGAHQPIVARNYAMMVFAALYGMRGSEVLALRWTDVHIEGGVCFVLVRKSKADKKNAGSVRPAAACTIAPWMCPVTWHAKLLAMRIADSVYVFHRGGRGTSAGSALSVQTMRKAFKQLVALGGLDPGLIGSHSGRVTFATESSEASVPVHVIKDGGNWASDCVMRYIRSSLDQRLRPSKAVQHSIAERLPMPAMPSPADMIARTAPVAAAAAAANSMTRAHAPGSAPAAVAAAAAASGVLVDDMVRRYEARKAAGEFA
jgi:integrase